MIDLKNCISWLKANNFKKVSLQISDDLLIETTNIISQLQENSDALIFMIGNSVYEKCCNDLLSSDHIDADACIHVGHACLSCTDDLPTFYVFPKQAIDVNKFCETFSTYFQNNDKNILLFYDVSYAHIIDDVEQKLKQIYKNLIVSKLACNLKTSIENEDKSDLNSIIVGRSYPVKNLEDYDGFFLGSNSKILKILTLSVSINEWHYYENSKINRFSAFDFLWLKKRNFLIEKIRDAERFGLVIASLNIKDHLKIMEKTKSILKAMSKKTYTFSVGKINPAKLANFQELDIYVIISCPENSLMDTQDYFKPIVTPFDVELAFNSKRNSYLPYSIDFKQILPEGMHYENFESNIENDVSLTSGKIRNFTQENVDEETLNEGSKCIANSIGKKVNVFQAGRWDGLQCKTNESTVNLAVKGRDGIPIKYENELTLKK